MAPKGGKMLLGLAIVVMTWHGAWAQSACTNALMRLGPCYGFVTGSSSVPSPSCCSELNWVIENQPECLCSFVKSGAATYGIVANQTLALTVPSACNLQNPSVTQCNVESGQIASVASPAIAPVGSQSSDSTNKANTSNDSPSQIINPSSAGVGSKTVPSTNNNSSGATVTKSPFCIVIFLLFMVSYSFNVFLV